MRNEEWCRLRRHMWKKGCTHEACTLGFGAVSGAACVAAHGAKRQGCRLPRGCVYRLKAMGGVRSGAGGVTKRIPGARG